MLCKARFTSCKQNNFELFNKSIFLRLKTRIWVRNWQLTTFVFARINSTTFEGVSWCCGKYCWTLRQFSHLLRRLRFNKEILHGWSKVDRIIGVSFELESYLFNTKNMTAAMSTKRHTRPKVKPTIKPTFDSDLAENRIKNMYVRKRNCYNKICHQSNCFWYLKLFVTPEVIYCEQCNVIRTVLRVWTRFKPNIQNPGLFRTCLVIFHVNNYLLGKNIIFCWFLFVCLSFIYRLITYWHEKKKKKKLDVG